MNIYSIFVIIIRINTSEKVNNNYKKKKKNGILYNMEGPKEFFFGFVIVVADRLK